MFKIKFYLWIIISLLLFFTGCLNKSQPVEKRDTNNFIKEKGLTPLWGILKAEENYYFETIEKEKYIINGISEEQKKLINRYMFIFTTIKSSSSQDEKTLGIKQIIYIPENPEQWFSSKIITIKGKLENGKDNKISLVENWESRSRVNYMLLGILIEDFDKFKEKDLCTITGYILKDKKNPWAGKIVVIEINY